MSNRNYASKGEVEWGCLRKTITYETTAEKKIKNNYDYTEDVNTTGYVAIVMGK